MIVLDDGTYWTVVISIICCLLIVIFSFIYSELLEWGDEEEIDVNDDSKDEIVDYLEMLDPGDDDADE